MSCIDENVALQFVEGLLSPERAAEVEAHVAGCDACRWLLADAGAAAHYEEEIASNAPTQREGEPLQVSAAAAPREPSAPQLTQEIADTYVIERFIGKGGMGTVFSASHRRLPRRFAIKFLGEACAADPKAVARLRREAEVTSSLAHPHIVEVTDFNATRDGAPFLVMELLEGEPLARRLRREGSIGDIGEVTEIVRQITSAVAAAHAEGVVHRDLKPTNIFLCRGEGITVKVMDFGISKVLGAQTVLTADLAVMGSPRYMAPEQARGQSANVDQRADIFALGAIIYEMLTGGAPFVGASVPETLFQVVYGDPADTPTWRQLPAALRQVILRALSKDPERRQRSMEELWQQFAAAAAQASAAGGAPAAASPGGPPPVVAAAAPGGSGTPVERSRRRAPWLWGAAGVAAAALLGIGGYVLFADRSSGGPDAPGEVRRVAVSGGDGAVGRQGSAAGVRGSVTADAGPAARRWLSVRSVPSRAPVFVDGASVGRTPLERLRISAGAARVVVRKRGYHAARRRITAGAQHIQLEVLLKRQRRRPLRRRHGSLTVQSKDRRDGRYVWATVYLDRRKVGRTALTLDRVPVGLHTVEVRRRGYRRQRRRVRVRRGRRTRVRFTLRRR